MTRSIEFKLFASRNKRVALIGSFPDWKEIPMAKTEDDYFRTKEQLDEELRYGGR
jgi:1,4-alpha-glucan branching enzyme